MMIQTKVHIATPGRGMLEITPAVKEIVAKADVSIGLCNIYIHHTSASLLITENHDPLVRHDMEAFMQRLVSDGDAIFQHTEEGPDDMSSHVRSALTQTFLTIPIAEKRLALGTWQGIFLWEHRLKAYTRHLTVTIVGE